MKKINIFAFLIVASLVLGSCNTNKKQVTEPVNLETASDSASYAIGIQISENFKSQDLKDVINFDALIAGINENIADESRIEMEATEKIVNDFFSSIQQNQHTDKVAAGEAFLAEKEKEAGVHKTSSGLMYKVITEGTGRIPSASDQVKTHYRGTLIDGTEFDSSYSRNEPAVFPVNGVIPGWVEALQLMKEGAKWELYIPYNLAYGERGAGRSIGPYETLVFEIELLSIE